MRSESLVKMCRRSSKVHCNGDGGELVGGFSGAIGVIPQNHSELNIGVSLKTMQAGFGHSNGSKAIGQ